MNPLLNTADGRIVGLLKQYNLWTAFLRGLCTDQVIASIALSAQEQEEAWKRMAERQNLDPNENDEACLQRFGMKREELREVASRRMRMEKFKEQTFSSQVEAYFLKRKTALDRVVYSLVRVKEAALARELYFRIKEGEQSFADVAAQFSQGPEAHTGGLVGPVPTGSVGPALAEMLGASEPGQLWAPVQMGEWAVVFRMEKRLPIQWDATIRAQLINELFEAWLENRVREQLAGKQQS